MSTSDDLCTALDSAKLYVKRDVSSCTSDPSCQEKIALILDELEDDAVRIPAVMTSAIQAVSEGISLPKRLEQLIVDQVLDSLASTAAIIGALRMSCGDIEWSSIEAAGAIIKRNSGHLRGGVDDARTAAAAMVNLERATLINVDLTSCASKSIISTATSLWASIDWSSSPLPAAMAANEALAQLVRRGRSLRHGHVHVHNHNHNQGLTQERGKTMDLFRSFPNLPIMAVNDAGYDSIFILEIAVDRSKILEASFEIVMSLVHEDMQSAEAVEVSFVNESGFGLGVARDWISCLGVALMDGILQGQRILHVRSQQPTEWMEFIGRIAGLALRIGSPIGFHMGRPLCSLVRDPSHVFTLDDLADVEPDVHRSVISVLNAKAQDELDRMLISFCVSDECELLPGGHEVRVDMTNRSLFAALLTEHYCDPGGATAAAAAAIRNGMLFASIDPVVASTRLATTITNEEMNMAIGGSLDPSADEILRLITVTSAGQMTLPELALLTSSFEAFVRSLPSSSRADLLRFWTGSGSIASASTSVPYLSLIFSPSNDPGRRPTSRTCYNQLIVYFNPDSAGGMYMSKEIMSDAFRDILAKTVLLPINDDVVYDDNFSNDDNDDDD